MSQNARCSKGMTATLFSVPKLQVRWKTHGKTFSEFSNARQYFFRIPSSSLSADLRKSGKTYSEKWQDFFRICTV
jgi:hypothetical protein